MMHVIDVRRACVMQQQHARRIVGRASSVRTLQHIIIYLLHASQRSISSSIGGRARYGTISYVDERLT